MFYCQNLHLIFPSAVSDVISIFHQLRVDRFIRSTVLDNRHPVTRLVRYD